MVRPPDISRARHPGLWLGAVCCTGVLFSLLAFHAVRGWQQADIERQCRDLARVQVEKLRLSLLRSMEVLHSLAALHSVEGRIDRAIFSEFVRPALARQPELLALSWNPAVPASDRERFLAVVRAAGDPDFEFLERDAAGNLVPAAPHDFHVPVCWIEPRDRNAAVVGFDLCSDPDRLRSLELARDTARPVATEPLRLAQAGTQSAENAAGFLVLNPVYRNGRVPADVDGRRRELKGFAVAVFLMNRLVSDTLQELHDHGIDAWLTDASPSGGPIGSPAGTGKGGTLSLEVANRRWTITYAPGEALAAQQMRWAPWAVMAGGLALSLMTSAYLYGGWRHAVDVDAANSALQREISVRLDAETAAAEASRAKSEFLASMSHEIRTPLNAILGYTQILNRDASLGAEQRDALQGIATSGHHLLGLINEILDLSKIEAGRMDVQPAPFDLAALGRGLTATFAPLCSRKRIGFRLEVPDGANSWVNGDEGKLRQVLINLAGNAAKFTRAGGVRVRFTPIEGDRWHFEVIDTGLGIPKNEQTEIFRPFHQGSGAQHLGGTGLGLTIAQRQVGLLGGTLELDSERGVGSRFHFTIPLPPSQPAVETARTVRRLAAGQSVHALVVDDHEENCAVIGGLLRAIGCRVDLASTGEQTFEFCARESPDIVFLDLLLPGVSGIEVARQLSSRPHPSPPKIVAHTASALPRYRDEALAAGCVDFITKPFTEKRLHETLERHLGVLFEYEPTAAPDSQAVHSTEGLRIELPEELAARLAVAAELHSTTVLKLALAELRARGPEERRLADHIRFLLRGYDLHAVQRVLATCVVPVHATPARAPAELHVEANA